MNPPIITLLPVCTKARVEMLSSCAGTTGGCAQYLPPVLNTLLPLPPPQTIISLPVQTAACASRPEGASWILVLAQLSVLGLYLLPVFKKVGVMPIDPPQMIISLPVHTAVKKCRPVGALAVL